MMWIRDCTRREFIDLMQAPLSARGGPNLFGVGQDRERQSSSELPQARAELQLLWADDQESFSRFPRVVIVNEGKAQDFLAWVVTFDHLPHTAGL